MHFDDLYYNVVRHITILYISKSSETKGSSSKSSSNVIHDVFVKRVVSDPLGMRNLLKGRNTDIKLFLTII